MRSDLHRAVVREAHDRRTGIEVWQKGIGQRDEREYTDIHCNLESLSAGLMIGLAQFIAAGEGDRMDEYIDLPKMFGCFLSDCGDLIVPGHVAFFDPFAAHLLGERLDALLEHLTCIADPQVCALTFEGLCNAPGNGAFVRQTKDQCILTFK